MLGELQKRCKYFDTLDEIFGERPQFNPPFLHHSIESNSSVLSPSNDNEFVVEEDLLSLPDTDNTEEGQQNKDVVLQIEGKGSEMKSSSTPKREEDSDILKKKFKKSPIKSAVSALEGAMKLRADAELKRLEWETENRKKEQENQVNQQQQQFELQKASFDFEKLKWKEEIEQKKVTDERSFELEKLKVEKEAETVKFKIEKEFELEKMKLQLKQ